MRRCQAVQLEKENYHYVDLDEDAFNEDDLDEDDFDDVFVCVLCFSFSSVFVCWNPEGRFVYPEFALVCLCLLSVG